MNVTGKVFSVVKSHYKKLTTTDRRIAAILTSDPELIAFGTVIAVAKSAETSGPSIVRFADKIGYQGFIGLQKAVRDDLSVYLSSSLKRIDMASIDDHIAHTQAIEIHNVESTLAKVDEKALNKFVRMLDDDAKTIYLLASDQCSGPANTFADLLAITRPRIRLLSGSTYRISNQLLEATYKDLIIVMDFERHERWLVETFALAMKKKAYSISITNNPLSSIATMSRMNFFASATAPGPFDSNTGLNALLNLIIAQLAQKRKTLVSKRLKRIHAQWENDEVFETP